MGESVAAILQRIPPQVTGGKVRLNADLDDAITRPEPAHMITLQLAKQDDLQLTEEDDLQLAE